MALITGSNALNTEFTPGVGVFRIQVITGSAQLQSRPAGGGDFAIEVALGPSATRLIDNDVAGTVYRWAAGSPEPTPIFRADQ